MFLHPSNVLRTLLAVAFSSFLSLTTSFAEEPFSFSGSLDFRGVDRHESDSVEEEPSLIGRLKIDTTRQTWRFHAWIEGGWDGSVKRPPRDPSLIKNFDEVYQSNSPYLEFKEFALTYSLKNLDLAVGIQRFAWGKLDEYPLNDLLNPWDYTQFILKPLEERKIGVPSFAATLSEGVWTYDAVWVPVLVPYRLPMPDERWAGLPQVTQIENSIPNAEIVTREPILPDHNIKNSNFGLRIKRVGDIDCAVNMFSGYDPRPVFKTTMLTIMPQGGMIVIDPGFIPDFRRIFVFGVDAAAVQGDLSLRAETAYTFNRYLNIRRELWGYPAVPMPGIYPLNPAELQRDTFDYGIGADYRLFEDGLLTVQGQQTVILGNTDLFYERKVETLLWMNLKVGWMNQRLETNLNFADNPEHGDSMIKVNAWYVLNDAWKAGITVIALDGPAQSLFGRFSRNDQTEAELIYSW